MRGKNNKITEADTTKNLEKLINLVTDDDSINKEKLMNIISECLTREELAKMLIRHDYKLNPKSRNRLARKYGTTENVVRGAIGSADSCCTKINSGCK